MADEVRVHPVTGATLRRGVRPFTFSFATLSRTVDVGGWYPADDGDGILEGPDLLKINAAQTEMRAEYAASVRKLRKSLKLTQEAAGRLIGGGKRAFQKYESGKMPPSDSAVAVIELLRRDPSGLEVLKRLPGRQVEG